MGLTTDRFRFELNGQSYLTELRIKGEDWHLTVWRDGEEVAHRIDRPGLGEMYDVRRITVPDPGGALTVSFGFIGVWRTACQVERAGRLVWRSHTRDFAPSRRMQDFLKWVQTKDEPDAATSPERRAREAELQALRPAIVVDIAMAVAFFFVAREFGLVTAAISGAAATLVLIVIDRFVRWNLTGGFVIFGAAMALISAGLALAFQDDTFVKLRGSVMGLIGAAAFFTDGLAGGKYLGKRMALYMSGLFRLDPRRASFAAAGGGLVLIAIDLPLVFLLTTDQWIWYNAFLDSLVAIPIFLGAMWLARERRQPAGSD